jgi:diguanylate cyclase (GGDEF)-like protein
LIGDTVPCIPKVSVDRLQHQQPREPAAATSRLTFPPVEQFMALRSTGTGRRWTGNRLVTRLRGDTQLLLAIAIALPVVAVEGVAENPRRMLGMLAPAVFVAAQFALTLLRTTPTWLPTARLAFCLAFLAMANVWVDATGTWPLGAIAIPVVALAAAEGGRGGTLIALCGMALMVVPLALPGLSPASRQGAFAIVMAAVAIAYGSRRVVANLERSSARLRRANLRARRRARELAAVESVGRLLAREGLTEGTLDGVMGVLEETFGYRYPSVYVLRDSQLELGAHRNYRNPIQVVAADTGVIGRVVRTRQPAFLPDARSDPDFLSADPAIVSEISIPLDHDGELFGVLNVETSGERQLDEDDFATMQIVGDRLAAALALGRERQKLTERAALLDRLTSFATVLGSSLDPATMDDEVAVGAATVIPADSVVLVSLDESSGAFLINAVAGGDLSVVGKAVEPGEGITGRAIAARGVVVDDRLERSSFPKAVADVRLPDVLAGMAAPMVIGDRVVGAVTWLRGDLSRPFTAQEREVAALLAGKVGLALANARLHQQTADAAIRDPLTGLHNRRHFDATVARDDALRRRTPAERRSLRSAILFDLDHFGKVNKAHGHQIGDRVLRLFAETLRARARASDLVARYGGEEFVVILDNATRDAAAAMAEDIRTAFARLSVETPGGERIASTVSAGCATLEPWEVEGSVLVERADVALAMAKHGGRNLVVSA